MVTNFSNLSTNQKKILITGYLYALSSLSQLGWLFLTCKNRQELTSLKDVPFFNWGISATFILYAWLITHLLYISIQLIKTAKEHKNTISISMQDNKKLGIVVSCLTMVTCATVLVVPGMFYLSHDNVLMIFAALIGGAVVFTNIQMVSSYHKKT